MNEATAQRLALVIQRNGTSLLEDSTSLQRLLAPGATEAPTDVRALVLMLDTKAVAHLRKWAKTDEPDKPAYAQMRDHMAKKYEQAGKLSADMARWALDAWMNALPELRRSTGATQQRVALALEALPAPPAPPPAPPPAVPTHAAAGSLQPTSGATSRNPYAPPNAPVDDVPDYVSTGELHFIDNGQAVAAGRGMAWFSEGWRLFVAHPLTWWLCLLVMIVISGLCQLVPLIGPLASSFLSPIFYAGLLLGAHAVHQNETLAVGDIFAGFKSSPGTLVLLTLAQMLLFAAVIAIVAVIFGGTLMAAAATFLPQGPGGLGRASSVSLFGSLGAALVLLLVLIVPVIAASYFSVALVAVGGQGVIAALRMSFWGCMKNMLPFLVYGVLFIVAAIVATIPFGLGWLVLLPVLITSTYAAYRDIFYSDTAGTPPPAKRAPARPAVRLARTLTPASNVPAASGPVNR